LQKNALFPWLVLVPTQDGLSEIIDLSEPDRLALMQEIAAVSELVREVFSPYKLNIAALGNVVEQLHIHIIARYRHDSAWPDPVWGRGSRDYDNQSLAEITLALQKAFAKLAGFVPLESRK
jgi:diadenosine tetraphosphate (Ap4A) HIT family hydrolase